MRHTTHTPKCNTYKMNKYVCFFDFFFVFSDQAPLLMRTYSRSRDKVKGAHSAVSPTPSDSRSHSRRPSDSHLINYQNERKRNLQNRNRRNSSGAAHPGVAGVSGVSGVGGGGSAILPEQHQQQYQLQYQQHQQKQQQQQPSQTSKPIVTAPMRQSHN